ncbi:MAG: hypothetical protein AAB766_05010 [Patescibacteria group bacterium]
MEMRNDEIFQRDENSDDVSDCESAYRNYKNLKNIGVGWWARLLLRISPSRGLSQLSRDLGQNIEVADKAHKFFQGVERIDLVPSTSGTRGFKLILDGSTALYFYQDGDHFSYDGFEVGEYDAGDVTVLDCKF